MQSEERTPIHLVAGALGAGKTTVLLELLSQLNEPVAVVVNDFGEAAFDSARLGALGAAIREIPGSCLCCTAPENFIGAVRTLLDEGKPQRIFVEPTGLARPADLVDTLRRSTIRDRVAIAPVVVVVDPCSSLRDPAALRAASEVADILIFSRSDRLGVSERAAAEAWVAGLWPLPQHVEYANLGRLSADCRTLLLTGRAAARPVRFRQATPSVAGFRALSRIWDAERRFSRESLADAVVAMRDAGVARFKGVFSTDEGVLRLEVAGGTLDVSLSDYRGDSRCDLIGAEGVAWEAMLDAIDRAVPPDAVACDGLMIAVYGRALRVDRAFLDGLPGRIADISAVFPQRVGAATPVESVLGACGAPLSCSVVVVAGDGLVVGPVPRSSLSSAWIVYGLGDGALPSAHGGPFRWLAADPSVRSCANVKNVVRIVTRAE